MRGALRQILHGDNSIPDPGRVLPAWLVKTLHLDVQDSGTRTATSLHKQLRYPRLNMRLIWSIPGMMLLSPQQHQLVRFLWWCLLPALDVHSRRMDEKNIRTVDLPDEGAYQSFGSSVSSFSQPPSDWILTLSDQSIVH